MGPGTLTKAARRASRYAGAALLLAGVSAALAQDTPLVSGSVAFLHGTNRGQMSFDPALMPVAVVPVKQHFVFESRGLFLETITPRPDKSDQTRLVRNLNYLQLDTLVGRHLTVIAGKFLTPFGTYNERLSPIWIGNFQDGPLIVSLGNNGSAGVGGELKGSLFATGAMSADYAAFFQSNVSNSQFKSSRATGGRINFYLPSSGLEFGASYDHMFQGAHPNTVGTHLWWEPHGTPFLFRSEYAHTTHSQGYWFETGYRLSRIHGPESWIGRAEPLFRMQQTFRSGADGTDGLPAVNTQRADFGLDYYLPHEVRINTSYTRQFSPAGNGNIWKTELVYRFLFPAWPGRKR